MFTTLPKDIQALVISHLLANDFKSAKALCQSYFNAVNASASLPPINKSSNILEVEPLSIQLPNQIEVLI